MIKVSFTDKETNIYNEKVVVVTLKGKLTTGGVFFLPGLDEKIIEWMTNHKGVSYTFPINNIVVSGKASCSPEDKFDPERGRRIAEARAKIKLYHFLWTLSLKLERTILDVLGGKKAEVVGGFDNVDSHSIIGCCTKYEVLYSQEGLHLGRLIRDY